MRPARPDEATRDAATDTSAFGRLYKEHFDGLYDFVARMVRDRDLAGEIVQSTFTKAWDELREGRELRHPKAWLYAVARNRSLDELRSRQRLADEPAIYAQVDPSRLSDPQAVAEDNEMVELVWSSAAALSPEEYSLLDLHVRHGLGAAEIADALDLERGAVYTRLSRLRNSLEESVALTLLIRRGRQDCPQLDAIVSEHGGMAASITPELRRTVRAHVKECEICGETRKRLVSPIVLFGALLPVVPIVGLQKAIWAGIVGGGAAVGAAAGTSAGGKGAVAARQGLKAKYWVAGAAGVAAVGATLALALSGAPKGHDPKQVASVDHTVGVPSSDPTVTMRWEPGKNAEGYSVVFSRDKSIEPPARENVKGTTYTSSPLSPGNWWFILRTHGKDGGWTDTVRVGPFVITAAAKKAVVAKTKPKRHERKHHKKAPARPAAPVTAAVVTAPAEQPSEPAAPREPKPKPKKKQAPKKKKEKPKKKSPPASVPAPAQPAPQGEPVTQNPPTQEPPPPAPNTNPPPCAHTSDGGGEGGGQGDGDQGGGDQGHGDDEHNDGDQCDPEHG